MGITHTPTPWRVDPENPGDIQSHDGTTEVAMVWPARAINIAFTGMGSVASDEIALENCALIVRACNAHYDILSALRQAQIELDEARLLLGSSGLPGTAGIYARAVERVAAVIAKAEGRP